MMYRVLSIGLLAVSLASFGCGSETPPAPVPQDEVEDLQLDLESGVETTPEEATQAPGGE